jgi:hypothetical protein
MGDAETSKIVGGGVYNSNMNENKTFAKTLSAGDEVFVQGAWRTVAENAPTFPGCWLYFTDGETSYHLAYESLKTR